MDKIIISRNVKQHNEYKLTATLTAGKILAVKNALEAIQSPVGNDVLDLLNKAIGDCNTHTADPGPLGCL